MEKKDDRRSITGTMVYTIPIYPPFPGDKMSIYDPNYLTREEAIDDARMLNIPENHVQCFCIGDITENIKRNVERYHLNEGGKLPPVPRDVAEILSKIKRARRGVARGL